MPPGTGNRHGSHSESTTFMSSNTQHRDDVGNNGSQGSFGLESGAGGENEFQDLGIGQFGKSRTQRDNEDDDIEYDRLMSYSDSVDYYSLLGLSRNPPPTDAQLRSTYRSLALSFYPDKQPAHLSEVATRQYDRIREAYETLIDHKKRAVYDLLGEEGVRAEWGVGGLMGRGRVGRSQEVGARAMTTPEFRQWFLTTMKKRERKQLNDMVQSRGSVTIGIDASSMFDVEDDEGTVALYIPTVTASSLSIGYKFKIPLPPLKDFRVWRLRAEEGETSEREETSGSDDKLPEPEQDAIPELSINASLGGELQHPFQRVALQDEETGEKEIREIELPTAVYARNLSLGASVNHTFQENGLNGGILKRFPFSLFSGSSINVSGILLPSPLLQTVISKSVAPIKGTRPLQLSLQTTCHESLRHSPPDLALQVSRQIGARSVAFCSWSSGSMQWPDIVKAIFFPFLAHGPEDDGEQAVSLGNSSKFSIGFIRPPQKRPKVVEDSDDDDGEDDVYTADTKPPADPLAKFDPRESWGVEIDTVPAGGSLTINYDRNLFTGKPEEPLRSEWSSEDHYAPQLIPTTRAVRLQVQTAIGSDLSLSWMITGSRRVGEFTRMGLGIGIQGHQGLVFSLSWSRLGQSIKVPITVCPAHVVDTDICSVAVILPWAVYTAVEFGILRPRERRRRRLAIARRRKELKKLTLKRKTESLQATSLMSDQVKRRQAREAENHGLVIHAAEYGCFPPSSDGKKGVDETERIEQTTDVSVPVAALVEKSQLIISKQVIKSQILGFHDPAPLQPKKLKIWYQFGGQDHFIEAEDTEGIICPMKAHLVSPETRITPRLVSSAVPI